MENTNRRKKMSPAKRRKKRIQKAFRIAGEVLVGIQILATLVFIGFTWRLGMVPAKYLAGMADPSGICSPVVYHAGGYPRKSYCQ
ncbi:MAG: hypothetical protein ACLT4D_11100 [Blautia faecis]